MFLKFINRSAELKQLNTAYSSTGFHFLVIYGRRRVGKTDLIKHFISGKKAIYFLCDKSGTATNVARLKLKIAEFLDEPAIAADDLGEIFSSFARKAPSNTIIVFDEFSCLIEKDDSISSVFQRVIDESLSNTDMTLVLCGSSISLMIDGVLAQKSPLYGRKTGHMRVTPLRLQDLREFFPSSTMKGRIKTCAVLGGVPFYLAKFKDGVGVRENIRAQILDKDGALYEETDFLLREELREPDVYKTIVSAVAAGATRVTEIADMCRMKPQDLDRYLKVLIRLGIVRKESPVTDSVGKAAGKGKTTLYVIEDPFFAFWFRFCEPRKADLEIGEIAAVERVLDRDFNAFVDKGFEKIFREELLRKLCPGRFTEIGRWWGYYREGGERREIEIDVLGLNRETSEAGFFECKWEELGRGEARTILDGLRQKAAYVEWQNASRKEIYGLFSRKLKGKESLREEGFLAFDLDDLLQTRKYRDIDS